ncbi:hypothetical protein PDIG_87200 [Penicillium digitatum PHI26]|uniref:Uncharacterized protein n=2 Tax=Penicillium digitatum TaxID=36651 RepID=K9FPR3_PEND2|nr:hypothetical protein PDIP_33220 [Penicillium digitatum Pd1]EKV04728.1 hypothetical protein PDIG_87200 [Penicillium digitatum PHI26]EKV17123.1 hypothetical protein PDIP_33220 [Penicillium digitatum Pd1]
MKPTGELMEPTMDPHDSPLSNLDLWCDWTGDPEEPVSITIAMELQTYGHSNRNLPILNVQSPNIVKSPSWVIRLKPDSVHYDADIPPGKEARHPGHECSEETEKYPANNGSVPDSGSVVVHDGLHDDDPQDVSRPTVNISGMYTQVDSSDSSTSSDPRKNQVNSLGGPNSFKSRKRSAKAASLPDSIPPDDDYQGTRHKLMMTKIDPPAQLEPASENTHTIETIGSSIPIDSRSGSLIEISVTPEKIPLPQDSVPGLVPVSPSVTSEDLSLNCKRVTVDSETELNETPLSKIDLSGTEPLTEANLLHRNYDALSTRGCNGSLSDTEDSDKEKEDPIFSLESIGSQSFFSCIGFHAPPLPRASADMVENHNKPKLILDNDILYVQIPHNVYSATYQIAIALKVRPQKGKSRDWWELFVNGLPRLAQFESGYLYFRTPPGQGMEFMTSSFKRHTLVESCLMAQFHGGKSLVVPFRKCNAEYYGQLKDYKVNTVMRAEITEPLGDPSSYVIKYKAVCSIDLINHSFWAERCKFDLSVYGGPEGEFNAIFAAKKPVINSIRLQPGQDGIGMSRIHIISIPQALEMFTVSWEVKQPRGMAVTWLPRVKTTVSHNNAEALLQEDYAIFGLKHEVVPSRHRNEVNPKIPFSRLAHLKPPVMETPAPSLQREVLLGHKPKADLASNSTSTQTVAVTPVAEWKNLRHALGLWTLIKIFVQLLGFLGSIYNIFCSYLLLRDCGFREVYVYDLVDCVGNLTSINVEKGTSTVLAEYDLQSELIQSEIQQFVKITPADITPMPLRDRIDYLLGWRGPIARE